jgi:hypothetical protein
LLLLWLVIEEEGRCCVSVVDLEARMR